MDAIICPMCGVENPSAAAHCGNCRTNLELALKDPDEIERAAGPNPRRRIRRRAGSSAPGEDETTRPTTFEVRRREAEVAATEAATAFTGDWPEQVRWLARWMPQVLRRNMAVTGAALAAIAALFLPTGFVIDGEICPGYKVDLSGYYLKLVPLTLVAAVLGAVLGRLIESGKKGGSRGCAIGAVVAGLAGCVLLNMFIAVFPGC